MPESGSPSPELRAPGVRVVYLRAFSDYMKQIPIPAATSAQQKPVERLVERILAAKQRDAAADVSALEREIDEAVYALCALTPAEIQLIEASAH
jgi:adenine-specific DNA-methyltransferase